MKTDVLIIGAGLCGLALARSLTAQGRDVMIAEARDRVGGRILSVETQGSFFDMGPAWFWPGQPRIVQLVNELGLEKFDQHADGIQSYEDESGRVQRGQGYASMQESWRLKGGLGRLTQTLAEQLRPDTVRLGAKVTALRQTGGTVIATLSENETITARQVVLALPPRIAAEISFVPALPAPALNAMEGVATWMAGQAKAVAVYDRPFWRNEGLSGDAISRHGPMVEIHDASPASGGPYALFGFIGVPPGARQDTTGLRAALLAQLERLFGPSAAQPVALHVKDWAFDGNTSTKADRTPDDAHPRYGLPGAMKNLWNNNLALSGTETAAMFGGYLEGALEAAEDALKWLNHE